MTSRVYLSRRNLLTLLSRLNQAERGDTVACTLVKYDNTHSSYPQTMPRIEVVAVEDDLYYLERPPGDLRQDSGPTIKSSYPFSN